MARVVVLKAALVGVVAGGLAIVLAACGSAAQSGVASLGKATTTTAQPAPAVTGGVAGGGVAANAGNAAPGAGSNSEMVMAPGNPADMLKFAQCMRSHGVIDFPDPSSNGAIVVSGTVSQSPQYGAADQTCHDLLPNGGIPTAAQRAQALAEMLKLSVCMRAHGISDFPDPTSEGIRIALKPGMPSDLVPGNPRLQAAQKACQRFGPG
ncbi:MAG TPA: hypothetical protein VL984_06585 [Acidimicrobiales bacterium]|nr:hypothetical protein [Acidimicrobiales bacterium]